jgi:hypothetical protein
METVVIFGLLVGGIINLLPLPGALSGAGLAKLYGIKADDPDLLIMLRHRSAVFAIVGLLLLAAIVRPELRTAAILAGLASAATFVVIAWQTGRYSLAIRRVVIADIVAVVVLVIAGVAWLAR